MKWCPVPGCLSKPQKKLSNHIIRVYPHVTTEERAVYLKNAKIATATDRKPSVVTTLTIDKAFKLAMKAETTEKAKVIHPTYKPRLGKTHHYTRFCTVGNKLLADFREYLTTPDGVGQRMLWRANR